MRKKLGGGSYTTIQDAMADWRKRKLEKAQPVVEPLPPEVAEALGVLAGEIWTVARTAAERGLASERERLVGEFTALQEQAREAIELADQLNEEAEQLRQAVAEGRSRKSNAIRSRPNTKHSRPVPPKRSTGHPRKLQPKTARRSKRAKASAMH
ncbi:DNA-binding protein [Xanthomonas albilineans]|uniref:DNA-binding protein n=1 Tax=Xanthomonas albilineans TaxID=29447 RepID=UPI0013738ADF|nr:DNA-binding protein [Xanthomonas albilineans]QHQ29924.1 putative kfra protein (plasmid) [Xanthomonas albilineans]